MGGKKQCNRWVILAIVYLACILASMNLLKVGPVLNMMMEQFEIGSALAGFIISCTSIAGMILVFPAARIVRKFGALPVGLCCIGLFIIGNLIGVLSQNLPVLMIGRVVEGFGMGMTGVTSSTIINGHFMGKDSKIAMAIWSTWFPVGGALATMLSSNISYSNFAYKHFPQATWKTMWLFCILLLAIAFVLYACIVREKKSAWGNNSGQNSSQGQQKVALYKPGLSTKKVWFMGFCFMALMMSNVGFLSWSTQFYASQDIPTLMATGLSYGAAANEAYASAGSIASLGYWFSVVGGIAAAIAANFVAKKNSQQSQDLNGPVKYEHIALIVCAVLALCIYPFGFIMPVSMRIFYLACIGIINGYACAVIFAVVPRDAKAPHLIGVTFAIIFFSQNVGAFLANPIMGQVIGNDQIWNHAVPYLLVVDACGVLFAILALTAKRQKLDGPWNHQGGWDGKSAQGAQKAQSK